jgi:hypothetical protein
MEQKKNQESLQINSDEEISNTDYFEIPSKEVFEQSELIKIITYEDFLSASSSDEEIPIADLVFLMSEEEKTELKRQGIL